MITIFVVGHGSREELTIITCLKKEGGGGNGRGETGRDQDQGMRRGTDMTMIDRCVRAPIKGIGTMMTVRGHHRLISLTNMVTVYRLHGNGVPCCVNSMSMSFAP
jgi:hypothetical protein